MSRARTPFKLSVSPTPFFNTSPERDEFRQAWVDLLAQYPWEWLGHFTFRSGLVHPETADKRFRLLVAMANRELHGPRWARKGIGISWARGLEWQRRGAAHYHALLIDVGNLHRLAYMDRWNDLAGFARIEQPHCPERVLRYITKYVVKGGEIDLGGPRFDPSPLGLRLPFESGASARLATPEPKGADGGVCQGFRRS